MIDSLLILFFLTGLVSLFPFEDFKRFNKLQNTIYLLLFLTFLYIAAFREPGVDRDYDAYRYWFEKLRDNVEYSFMYISEIIKKFGGTSIYLFITYAIIGVSTKFLVIKKVSVAPMLSLVVYLGYLYPLQDLTQIRAGAAAGIILLAIYFLMNEKKWYAIFFVALAIFFHYSSFVIIPLLFLSRKKFNRLFFILAILISYGGAVYLKTFLDIIIDYLPPIIKWKILAYDAENNLELNIFNGWQLLRIGMAFLFIWNVDKLFKYDDRLVYLLKVFIIGICSFPLLSFNPVFAVRVSDLYFVSELLLLPSLILLFPAKPIMKMIVIVYAFAFLYLNLYYIGIFSK